MALADPTDREGLTPRPSQPNLEPKETTLMKTTLLATLACTVFLPTLASAQLNPKLLPGRWMMVSSSPTLEAQAVEYADVVGYSPARAKER